MVWWFFLYSPMIQQIHAYERTYQQAGEKIKLYPMLNGRLLEEKRELLHLGLQKSRLPVQHEFTLEHLSKELLEIINQSDATISFFRCKNWREKGATMLCDVEISLQGSFAGILCLLHMMSARNTRLRSCIIKKNSKDSKLDLTATFKIVARSSPQEAPKSVIHHPQDFTDRPDIFFGTSTRNKELKQLLKKQVAKLKESPLQKPLITLAKISTATSRKHKSASYRPKKVPASSAII